MELIQAISAMEKAGKTGDKQKKRPALSDRLAVVQKRVRGHDTNPDPRIANIDPRSCLAIKFGIHEVLLDSLSHCYSKPARRGKGGPIVVDKVTDKEFSTQHISKRCTPGINALCRNLLDHFSLLLSMCIHEDWSDITTSGGEQDGLTTGVSDHEAAEVVYFAVYSNPDIIRNVVLVQFRRCDLPYSSHVEKNL